MTRALVALGSNQGDRAAHLEAALAEICKLPKTCVAARSTFQETEPVGPPQPRYLNAAAEVVTQLSARELLRGLLAIEARLGRVRRERWGPRTIDLDLVLFEELVSDEPDLEVPHPRFRERAFVLEPLAEIAPEARDPVTGKTVEELLRALG